MKNENTSSLIESREKISMFNEETQKNINNGLAKGMEKTADSIAKDDQLIRDENQPLGRFVPEEEQEYLNNITISNRKDINDLREKAAQLRKME